MLERNAFGSAASIRPAMKWLHRKGHVCALAQYSGYARRAVAQQSSAFFLSRNRLLLENRFQTGGRDASLRPGQLRRERGTIDAFASP
ncbi:hypothetical protein SAMN04487926_109285 [Paraburkholderia steynii]|uniref:Uncharacterized protein n=1 Tax=Paraburkholderia steynii TaxID=1245441 RepID=A0A7Z7BAI5_9BURK|nr:hypothetical protein SAMN04487926_109285 [Paraburkholderia steynii]